MELIIGTKSTWSLRVLLCAKIAGISCTEVVIDLQKLNHHDLISEYSESGLVPVLRDGELVINDSLAIMEYLNEISDYVLLPRTKAERAVARSICAELHSGFHLLRSTCPFTFDKVQLHANFSSKLEAEINRVENIFGRANLPFMYDDVCAVDAFLSVMAFRLAQYGIYLSGHAGEYQSSLLSWSIFRSEMSKMRAWSGL